MASKPSDKKLSDQKPGFLKLGSLLLGNKRSSQVLVYGFFAPVLGFASVCIPAWLFTEEQVAAPLFPWIRTAVEFSPPIGLVFLFLSGLFLGSLRPQHPVLLGISLVVLFPLLALIELSYSILSHPHFQLEFLYYTLMGAVGTAGAYRGGRSARRSH